LFLCVGAPKAEKWIYENKEKLDFGVALCVGAAVDFIAGNVSRAPELFRNVGLEWLWRLLHEPKRLWKRYLIKDSQYLYYAFKEFMRLKFQNTKESKKC
jgi:N-acetylglucosaminyldiphosphoundecaprenol N-acetyl-beta-D-mannosaminyltransferase